MTEYRRIVKTQKSRPTMEGAGVRLKRAFGYYDVPLLDPFLMLDDFHSSDPSDYIAGFPWHPHRGIETVTYMLSGEVKHGDSIGNVGEIDSGDIQWMTAGSGIVHQEMPQRCEGELWGFQLWVNLPASQKMMDPRYRDIRADQVPSVSRGDKVTVKVIAGKVGGVKGPVHDIIAEPEYLDVTISAGGVFEHSIPRGHKVFVYDLKGDAYFDPAKEETLDHETLGIYGDGDLLKIEAGDSGIRFLLVSGRPIGEPVAWRGPIVMNTMAELEVAFDEYERGTFIKSGRAGH